MIKKIFLKKYQKFKAYLEYHRSKNLAKNSLKKMVRIERHKGCLNFKSKNRRMLK